MRATMKHLTESTYRAGQVTVIKKVLAKKGINNKAIGKMFFMNAELIALRMLKAELCKQRDSVKRFLGSNLLGYMKF